MNDRKSRRHMLKSSLLASLSIAGSLRASLGHSSESSQDSIVRLLESEAAHTGPFFMFVEMKGGWDTTQFCDPKDPRISGADKSKTRSIGPFRLVDHSHWPDKHAGHSAAVNAFFDEFAEDLLQIDGVQTAIATHGFGLLELNTGSIQASGNPNFLAAIAASLNPNVALPYITNSDHMITSGLVQAVPTLDMGQVRQVLTPNQLNPERGMILPEKLHDLVIRRLQEKSLQQSGNRGLEFLKKQHLKTALSHKAAARLKDLVGQMDALIAKGISERFAFCIAAMLQGLTVSCQVSFNYLDTHSEHFDLHPEALGTPFREMRAALSYMKEVGLLEKTTTLVASEFGRTPYYGSWQNARPLNAEKGKDHWKHSSLFLMGRGIKGFRRVGKTTDQLVSMPVSFDTLQPADEGRILTLGHVHAALRTFAGVTDEIETRFPLRVEGLPRIFET